jgi:hypothetical protein
METTQELSPSPHRGRFMRGYKKTAMIFLNLFVLFVAGNIAIGVAMAIHGSSSSSQSQSVNISQQGFRISPDQGPWPIGPQNYNVFFFGGSATEGFGVRDDQTVPACFQSLMQNEAGQRVCVYNFGRDGYTSTQELILFERLLADGARPNLAVFVDGLNDFLFPPNSANADEVSKTQGIGTNLLKAWQAMPIGRAIARQSTAPPPDFRTIDPIVIEHYVFNKNAIEAIAKSYDISTVFVFQPKPADLNEPGDQCAVHGYPLMAQYVKDNGMGDDFLWLADVQQATAKPLYIDKWHYNPEFSQQIAMQIRNFLQKRPDSSQMTQVGDAK